MENPIPFSSSCNATFKASNMAHITNYANTITVSDMEAIEEERKMKIMFDLLDKKRDTVLCRDEIREYLKLLKLPFVRWLYTH